MHIRHVIYVGMKDDCAVPPDSCYYWVSERKPPSHTNGVFTLYIGCLMCPYRIMFLFMCRCSGKYHKCSNVRRWCYGDLIQ